MRIKILLKVRNDYFSTDDEDDSGSNEELDDIMSHPSDMDSDYEP